MLEGWTLEEVTSRMQIYPSRVSELRHGNLARFSIGRLVRLIASLGYDIEIGIRRMKPVERAMQRPTASVVRHVGWLRPDAR